MSESDIWCDGDCDNPSDDANYYEDGNNKVYKDRNNKSYICSKHHWSCSICNKIIQIG